MFRSTRNQAILLFIEFRNLSWKKNYGWSKIAQGMCSCSSPPSPSTNGSPNFKPTSIRLIMMQHAMLLLLLVLSHEWFLEFSKNRYPLPLMDRTPEIDSPDFKPTYILPITIELAMRLLLVLPHGWIFEFFKNLKKFIDRTPEIVYPNFNELLTVRLKCNMMYLIFSLFIVSLEILHYLKKNSLPPPPCTRPSKFFIRLLIDF